MFSRLTLISSGVAVLISTPVTAGPCTQRIADLGKAITAKHEGAGPALANQPSTTGSTAQATTGGAVLADAPRDNEAMRLLQQAKELDQQGKETDCMQMIQRVESMAPPVK